ncbi:mechanosensitive ion channel [Candidatus Bathyarchaeota archaeon]|nr:mechanosensitive ion channel [Candidatus Bathyarchaeota archaeon]
MSAKNEVKSGFRDLVLHQSGWLVFRILLLVTLHVLVEAAFRVEWPVYVDPEVRGLAYEIALKFVFTLYVLFFLQVFRRLIIPSITASISPMIDRRFVRRPIARRRFVESISRFLLFTCYLGTIIALIQIWMYSLVGSWLLQVLGTGFVIVLTFAIGLFTSSVLGNLIAYGVLSNVSEFKRGDRVQIGETYGDVDSLGFFFTRIRTIKNEIVSIPNLGVFTKQIQNFSSMRTVLIYIPITLGYDINKDVVKKLLVKCAEKTENILTADKYKPFVLLRELGRYTVTYEINVWTRESNKLIEIKSELIDNILSGFKRAKIELLSPTYVVLKEEKH